MLIRPVAKEDAKQLHAIINEEKIKEGISALYEKSLGDTESLIENLTDRDHFFILETETPPVEICAALLMKVYPRNWLRNSATMEIIVSGKWQGQGLGKALMVAALNLADNELMIERIEVEIDADNENALKLYKSFGFKVEGTARDRTMKADGTCADVCLLARCRSDSKKRAAKK